MVVASSASSGDRPASRGVNDEIHHRHHQTIQARRGARSARGHRRGWDDRVRGQRVRPPEGSDRDLPRRRILDQHAAQGEAGDRGERCARPASGRDAPADRQHRQHRRRQDLRARPRVDHADPHRRNRRQRALSRTLDMRDNTMIRKLLCGTGALGASLLAATAARAQEAAEAAAGVAAAVPADVSAPVAEAAAAVPNPGNNAWMMTATVLVLLMILPGLALFYGGLTRSKNMLSTMTQIGATAALAFVIWVLWGYSTAFGPEGNAFFSWGNLFL